MWNFGLAGSKFISSVFFSINIVFRLVCVLNRGHHWQPTLGSYTGKCCAILGTGELPHCHTDWKCQRLLTEQCSINPGLIVIWGLYYPRSSNIIYMYIYIYDMIWHDMIWYDIIYIYIYIYMGITYHNPLWGSRSAIEVWMIIFSINVVVLSIACFLMPEPMDMTQLKKLGTWA